MPIRRQLRSFWWFLEGRVGGMGRPGFNQCHWFELSFEEGLLLSWLGKQHLPTGVFRGRVGAHLELFSRTPHPGGAGHGRGERRSARVELVAGNRPDGANRPQ